MAQQYAYNYAKIDENGFCYGVYTTSRDYSGVEGYVEIPEYNNAYMGKYYLNGAWYEDAAGTIPWSPEA